MAATIPRAFYLAIAKRQTLLWKELLLGYLSQKLIKRQCHSSKSRSLFLSLSLLPPPSFFFLFFLLLAAFHSHYFHTTLSLASQHNSLTITVPHFDFSF